MKVFAKKPATYRDIEALPPHVVGELLGGELIVSPRPALEHSQASSVLGIDLGGPFDRGRGGPGGWWIRDEPELHFSGDVLVPDLAGWRRSRCPQPPRGAFATQAPDWVCEVLSPSTTRVDRVLKLPVYLREGVQHVWLVDPASRTLEIYRNAGAQWLLVVTHGGSEKVRAEPFAEIELDLDALWVPEEEPPKQP